MEEIFKSSGNRSYRGVKTDDDLYSTDTEFDASHPLGGSRPQPHQKSYLQLVLPWMISTITFAIISVYLLLFRHASCPSAYPTDLPDARPHIVYEERTFTGRFAFDEQTGKIYKETDPSQPQYFGEPSPEIDAAWEDLLRGEFINMTEREKELPYYPDFSENQADKFVLEPDMFHSLHCLNAVRMSLDMPYYSQQPLNHLAALVKNSSYFPDNWHRMHIDHCLDQLRQSIQCQGDLSPVPAYYWADSPIGLGIGQKHTCRKWEPIRAWMDQRA